LRSADPVSVARKLISRARFIADYYASSRRFDSQRGTSTTGLIPPWLLLCGNPVSRHAVRYQACSEHGFVTAMNALKIQFGEYAFVDLGCGKGRPLVMARESGFRRLIGVELSKRLCKICRSNCPTAHVIQGDAGTFQFPEGNIVVFLFNPFSDVVMKRVAVNLLRHQGACFLVYVNPKHRWLFDSDTRFLPHYFDDNLGIWFLSDPNRKLK